MAKIFKNSILSVRDAEGNIIDIPAIKGKSAYEYAVEGGYMGTEVEFAKMLAGDVIPDYWISHLDGKADAIQVAMEKAGKNKSAFLWYTDAHWINGNSKMSPILLDYLYRNTPMNKVNFGGDVIGDRLLATREEMKYLYEWREATKGLPKHHSVCGNHDLFTNDEADFEGVNFTYAYLIAPEESYDMVPGHRFDYYIDNPCEKTRYLYLDHTTSSTDCRPQGAFIVDAITSVPDGWHIVAIKHRWFQYNSTSTPTTGSVPAYVQEILSVFDAYNARITRAASDSFAEQDFTEAKGKVEFCIGGHIHVDYDFTSDGGIPIILTASDTNQNRSVAFPEDGGELGTTTECAVYGIIADYNSTNVKITVVGVGRGNTRVVTSGGSVVVTPMSITNISYLGDTVVGSSIDVSKISYTVNYNNGSSSIKTGSVTVYPTTIEAVGDNVVTVNYTEKDITVTGTLTIVGTEEAAVVNQFNKDDPDILIGYRKNSSNQLVYHAENQLITGWIEGKVGDTFTITTDKPNNANNYTGILLSYDANKNYVADISKGMTANGVAVPSSDYLTITFTIPESYELNSSTTLNYTSVAWVRFCVAYYDINNIVITKLSSSSDVPTVENMVDYTVHSADWKLNSRYNSSLELKTGVANHHITNVFHIPTTAEKVYMKYMNPTGSYARIYPFASVDAAKPAANVYINPASGATWTTRLDAATDYYVIDMAAFRTANANYANTEYFAIGFYYEDESYSPASAIVQIDEEIV